MSRSHQFTGLLLLTLLIAGCAASNRSNFYTTFLRYSTFTCVPYSALAEDTAVAGPHENAMLFELANQLIARGYEYTPLVDSADFIATVWVTDSFERDSTLRPPVPPPFRRVTPFGMTNPNFASGGYQPSPKPFTPSDSVRPEVAVILYAGRDTVDAHKALRIWQGGAVANGADLWYAAQYLMDEFANRLPMRTPPKDWYGTGVAGLRLAIRTPDGVNFWPRIDGVIRGYPGASTILRRGDVILELNGHSLENLDYGDCLRLFRGDPGRELDLHVWRYPATTFDVSLTMTRRVP